MNIPHLIPTASIKTIEVGPPDKRRQITVQVCDLFLPERRHPLDYEYNVQDGQLAAGEIHFLTGDNLFQTNRYGVELNTYGVRWLSAKEYYEQITALLKGK